MSGRETPASTSPIVLSVAFPYAPVGPQAVGGAEVICSQLEAALHHQGFTSVVVAHSDSKPQGRLYPTRIPSGTITDAVRVEVETAQQASLDRALQENAVFVVHMHGLDFHRYRISADLPVVVTLHLPPSWYPESIWTFPSNYRFICVSETQRRACPDFVQDRVAVIQNGVPIPDPKTLRSNGRYALMLARICPEKNLHVGFDAAREAGMPAMLGGDVFPYETHLRYLEEQIRPRLNRAGMAHEIRGETQKDEPTARFLGPVTGEEKQRFLARAACLLLPSLAPETSSLVAMEALAAGTPVIAMASGAIPEIVEDGRTGFLIQPDSSNTTQDMAEALRRLPELDRQSCRTTAEARFPLDRMVERYCELYRSFPVRHPRSPDTDRSGVQESLPSTERPENQVLPHVVHPLRMKEICDDDSLRELQAEWEAIWRLDPRATPFQHPAWLLPWWHQFGPDGELHALTLRSEANDALVAFFPLYTYAPPGYQRRQMLFLGAGTTDYLDGVCLADCERIAGRVVDHVLQHMTCWDQLSLFQLRSHSLLRAAARVYGLQETLSEPCSTLRTDIELPPKIRGNLARYRRLAAQQGTLVCELAESIASTHAAFDELVALHSQRWEERGEDGVLRDLRVLAHHRESLPLLLEAGLLRLFRLTLEGQTIGVLYGLADGQHASERRLYLYLVGFSGEFAALSPGSLLLHEAWLYAREHGFHKVDLLRGGEGYKQLWGAEVEPTFALNFDRQAE